MSGAPETSRPPPPDVAPIEHKGVRYEQDLDGGGLGGFLVARDAKTGAVLWRLEVFHVVDESAAGVDAIGLYFAGMSLVPGREALAITDEAGRRFTVDLATRAVRQEGGLPAKAPTAPAKPKPSAD